MALTVIDDEAVGPVGFGGQRVCAPLTDPVDVDTDADVLAGRMGAPAAARLDDQAHGVSGFGMNRHDPAAQVRAGPQGIDDVEVIGREQGRGHPLGKADEPVAQRAHRVALGAVVVI